MAYTGKYYQPTSANFKKAKNSALQHIHLHLFV